MLGYLIQAAFQQLFHEKVKCQKACMLHVCVRVYVPSSCLDRVSQTAPYILSLGKIFDRDRERLLLQLPPQMAFVAPTGLSMGAWSSGTLITARKTQSLSLQDPRKDHGGTS